MNKVYLLVFVLFLCSCDKNEIDIEFPYEGDGTQIEIYLLKSEKEENYKYGDKINKEDLQEIPWLAYDDIEFYDWSSHTFYLKSEKSTGKRGGNFFICADKEPILRGYFHSFVSSSLPPFPSIMVDFNFYPRDVLSLNSYHFFITEEIELQMSKLRVEMENSGLLREGVKIELMGLVRLSSSELKYTFKVTNIDTENIYVLDPDRMGASRFHYYTNGVSLRIDEKTYYTQDLESEESEYEPRWYYKLTPGQAITRTVRLSGFLSLPTGRVDVSFMFPSQSSKIVMGEWKKPNGRIWLGNNLVNRELNLD